MTAGERVPAPRIGVFGGTFDPPQVAHLQVAAAARRALDLQTVLLVVANEPWQKVGTRPVTPAAHRLAMVERAVEGHEGLEACDLEIRRGGPSYTVDTLRALRDRHPGAELVLVVGEDTAAGIPTWEQADALAGLAVLAVVRRPGADPAGLTPLAAMFPRLARVEGPLLDVSSTEVRERLASGRPVEGLVPDAVVAYAREHGLYGLAASAAGPEAR